MNFADQWNKLSGRFNYYVSSKSSSADERRESVWPIFIDAIKQNIPKTKNLRALDFGCGTGMFCLQLEQLGFDVTGIDIAADMIKIGQENLPRNIKLFVGNAETAKSVSTKNGKFDVIASGMVLQFIDNNELEQLAQSLNDGGFLIFANHSARHLETRGVKDNLKITGTDVAFPIYRRTNEEYDSIFSTYGFVRVLEKYSTLVSLPENGDEIEELKLPKYVILGYKK